MSLNLISIPVLFTRVKEDEYSEEQRNVLRDLNQLDEDEEQAVFDLYFDPTKYRLIIRQEEGTNRTIVEFTDPNGTVMNRAICTLDIETTIQRLNGNYEYNSDTTTL